MQPLPPSPAFTLMITSSMNMNQFANPKQAARRDEPLAARLPHLVALSARLRFDRA